MEPLAASTCEEGPGIVAPRGFGLPLPALPLGGARQGTAGRDKLAGGGHRGTACGAAREEGLRGGGGWHRPWGGSGRRRP